MISDSEPSAIVASQRNSAIVAAILMIAVAFGTVLPGMVRRTRELKAANAELVALQGTIVRVQGEIRNTEADIIRTQGEISTPKKHN